MIDRKRIIARIRERARVVRMARLEGTDPEDLPDVQTVRPRDYRFDASRPCDDDPEAAAPYVGILPEESDSEGPSPLRF